MKTLRILAAVAAIAIFGPLTRAEESSPMPDIPDVVVQDQQGHSLHFYRDLLQGHVVAVNFVFTTCSTICPQLGATSAALARELARVRDPRLRVVSISFDPGADTPARLNEWASNFGAAPGWTLVTGTRRDIDELLRAFQVYTADKTLHSSNFLVGYPDNREWRRVAGTAAPVTLAAAMRELLPPSANAQSKSAADAAAARYFPDVPLVDQDGKTVRFYSDLLRGRVVVIDSMYSDCGAACPLMAERFAKVQHALGDRVGRDVFLLSISVDPVTDTPAKLHEYAEHVGAKPGWEFLTGDKANVDIVLKKLGQYVDTREAHSNLVIIGNEPTGLWKKAFGLAAPEDIVRIVQSVANDRR